MSWNVTMIPTKFLGTDGGYTSGAIQALDYLTVLKLRHGLNIVASNNSWDGGGYNASSGTSMASPHVAGAVVVRNDSRVEADESFFMNLSRASGATISVGRGTGPIRNDDGLRAAMFAA